MKNISAVKNNLDSLFRRSRYVLAAGAGLLLAAAFPNFSLAGFAWIAPALLLFAARGQTGADAFRTGYVGGLAFWLSSLAWLLRIPVTGFPILGWLALTMYLALFFGAWVWLVTHAKLRMASNASWSGRATWMLLGAALWVALEMLRARLFGGFPWNLLGGSQFKLIPLIQIAAVTGVYGLSFLVAWFALALVSAAEMICQQPAKRHVWQAEIALPLVAVLVCYLGGFFQLEPDRPAEKMLRVMLVQPSVPQSLIWNPGADEKRFRELLARSQAALTNETDLVVWPESALPALDETNYPAIVAFAQSNHVWLVFNGDDVEVHPGATNFFNAALLMNPEGRIANIYHKRQLVIFGEYVPLARWLPFLKWFTPIQGGWTPGERPAQFFITRWGAELRAPQIHLVNNAAEAPAAVKLSPLICFEDVFAGTAREAAADDTDFWVNLTNDGWFGDGAAQWQHAAGAVFRAVENRKPLLRCANNGVTCWIDGYGRIRQLFTDENGNVHGSGVLTIELPLPTATSEVPTFYHRHGDWFGWACVGLTLLNWGRFWRQRTSSKPATK